MTFVVSEGQLRRLGESSSAAPAYRVQLSDTLTQDYATIWRTQPAVRTVVDFLARNIAQLGLHTFERISDVDRRRLSDHPLSVLLARPSPRTTRYRWIDTLVHDIGIYDVAYQLKLKADDGRPGALLRLDPRKVTPLGDLMFGAERFRLKGKHGQRDFPADQVIHFRGYNPDDARVGTSPIETLRQLLIEEYEAGRYRQQMWRSGARMSGIITRPAGANWSDGARRRFKEGWRSLYAGDGPEAGGTPILEDGMTFEKVAFTAEQAQYVQARKLTREEVAAAYHIPPPMVGLLDNATFSNITEQHKQLYQDTLGPWLTMISEEIHLQLLPDLDDSGQVYVEFNLAEKLRGSFEEQAGQLQTAVGGPWLTRNEARARMNLPQIDSADELIVPLNVLTGGQASPTDSAPPEAAPKARRVKALHLTAVKAMAGDDLVEQATKLLTEFFERQSRSVLSRAGADTSLTVEDLFDVPRWAKELTSILAQLNTDIAEQVLAKLQQVLEVDPGTLTVAAMVGWLEANAAGVAEGVSATTAAQIALALAETDPLEAIKTVFTIAKGSRGPQIARTQVTAISGFATEDAAKRAGYTHKTWLTTHPRPRPSHAALSGQKAAVGELFSNGGRWPGDPKLALDERAGCTCDMTLTREES
ncbi:phage portal protein [Sphaerisporangium sp. NPDC004334]